MTCLYCRKPLSQEESAACWHAHCSSRFFGTPHIPDISIDNNNLKELARCSLNAGYSVTGVQKKLSLHLEKGRGSSRLTLVGYPAGYILKPPSEEYPELPEYEDTVMRLADATGIPAVPHGMVRLQSGEAAYITRRIDREGPRKRAMEDFCQLSGRLTEDKYKGSAEQCGKIISRYSSRPGLDLTFFYQLLLFSFLTANSDMHLKSYSLINSPSGWVLSPAYDLLPSQLIIPEDREESALTIHGKKSGLSRSDFHTLGKTLGIAEKVINALTESLLEKTELHTQDILDSSFLSEEAKRKSSVLLMERIRHMRERT
jgi:serine/threonine-protein kinase HipA